MITGLCFEAVATPKNTRPEQRGKKGIPEPSATVISRYTYGGFSSFVKNVFDRCIGYALPQLEVVEGETHHKKRYDEDKPFTFVFYGNGLSGSQKDSARRYVKAVSANIRWHVSDVVFKEVADVGTTSPSRRKPPQIHDGKIILLNGSMRDCNSAILANKLSQFLRKNDSGVSHYLSKNDSGVLHHLSKKDDGVLHYLSQNDSSAGKTDSMREIEHINLRNHLNNLSLLMSRDTATDIVIATPLYVDGLPSQVTIAMWFGIIAVLCGVLAEIYYCVSARFACPRNAQLD